MDKISDITAVILSGGKSSRMGEDKGLVKVHNQYLIEYVINLLEKVTDSILISTNNKMYKQFGHPLISDLYQNIGPIGGLYSSLKASESKLNFVISCDLPLVEPALVYHLYQHIEGHMITVPLHHELPEPLCGFYDKALLPLIEDMINNGTYKMMELIRYAKTASVVIDKQQYWYHEKLFFNVNDPLELNRIKEFLLGKKE